jgi:hypothetical protein
MVINIEFYILLTVHLDVVLVIDQLDALFLNVFISCLYMFRATSAHHQEGQIVSIHRLVQHTLVGDCLTCGSRGKLLCFPLDRHVR